MGHFRKSTLTIVLLTARSVNGHQNVHKFMTVQISINPNLWLKRGRSCGAKRAAAPEGSRADFPGGVFHIVGREPHLLTFEWSGPTSTMVICLLV